MYGSAARFVSRLTTNTLALVLAGGRGERLGALTDWRTKPAVPFGGKFRIIDFTLSNCLHSGIRKVCVLTQYKSHSLIQHVMRGWTYLNTERGDFLDVVPAQQWTDDETWFLGTADAVYQSLDIIIGYGVEHVLILAGDHVYNMDYGEMLAEHVNTGADFTVACLPVPLADAAGQFGVMEAEKSGRIIGFEEKPTVPWPMPDDPGRALASMGIYIASLKYLIEVLHQDAADTVSAHDFGKDVIPKALSSGDHLQAYRFHNPHNDGPPYWRDVGTLDAYYDANLELLSPAPPMDLYNPSWPTLTYQPQLPPAHFTDGGRWHGIEDSMVSGGCVIEASRLRHSILFSNVKVHEGCALDSVLALPGCEIGAGSKLTKVILDNRCQIPAGTVIGADAVSDRQAYHVTENGVVVVNRKLLGLGERYMPGVLPQAACQPDEPK
ncbi:MAG: glucose-1-phosphate adenylyltransferase [Alphaproteobacteria bacterium]|jgi:glucose-1-phosphate adenylyltransferase|nr:glucose-1-phosphate adenylyltransferase [Alphaproteobacteria bacterium]